jgi:hypothetical protein
MTMPAAPGDSNSPLPGGACLRHQRPRGIRHEEAPLLHGFENLRAFFSPSE